MKSQKPIKILIWIFPLAAMILSLWLVHDYYDNLGPKITILFDDAANMEAGQTKVVYRGIEVGSVIKTRLTDKADKAQIVVRMSADTDDLLRKGTRFILVQPEVGLEGISGLETLLKGPIIQLEPGKGEAVRTFVGVEKSELGSTKTDSVVYYLETSNAESLDEGDPVYYRGMKIGTIVGIKLNQHGDGVVLSLAISNQSVRVIRDNSRFWRKRAVDADLGLFGSEIKIGSLETMMKGGINVATPNPPGKIANKESSFSLLSEEPEKWQEWNPILKF